MKTVLFDQFAKKVTLFGECVQDGRKAALSEAQTRLEFIDPMFRALGWDVGNEQALNQFDREVIVEEALGDDDRVTKTHPDYTFKTVGRRLFFVEAKRPAVDVRYSQQAALQVRRYAWSAQLHVSVLTDFEELALYDGTVAPKATDDARQARSFYKTFDRYLDEWEEVYTLLSREAVLSGALEALADAQSGSGVSREPFDRAFLADLERWRLLLAQAIQKDNRLTQAELNAATQLLLDRIIFLRVAEARGVQPSSAPTLLDLLTGQGTIYARLLGAFRGADDRYNSGLFHFRAERGRDGSFDQITPRLTVADKPLSTIVKALYPPESPYAFSAVPADILGSVYERFLGKTLSTNPAGKVVVEIKPEVRKQGGVFYTPAHIVRYMVQTVVGRWIHEHKADDLRSIRLCDPACGSGAFLVAAYEFIAAEHIRRYLRRQDTISRFLVKQSNGTYALIAAEKKRILKDCIFGIDIDPVAVEITKLSLLLAVLEGETRESVDRQLGLFLERPLPDVSLNIICANSLLSTADLDIADLPLVPKIKPLDWDRHSATRQGFDILIGNPPYVFGEWHDAVQLRVLNNRLAGIKQVDLYHAFIELVVRYRKPDGYWSLIIPDPVLARDDTALLRRLMLERGDLIASHVAEVFSEAAVSCVVLTQGPARHHRLEVHDAPRSDGVAAILHHVPFSTISGFTDAGFRLSLDAPSAALLMKLSSLRGRLGDLLSSISRGEEFGKKDLFRTTERGNVPCVVGEDIQPYQLRSPAYHIPSSAVRKSAARYGVDKAVTIKTGLRPKTAIDRVGFVTLQSVYNLHPTRDTPVELIAAVLNSRIASWYIRAMYTSYKKLFPQMNQNHITDVPLPEFGSTIDIVKAVRLLEACTVVKERDFLIEKLDAMMTAAYGLTEAECRLVQAGC